MVAWLGIEPTTSPHRDLLSHFASQALRPVSHDRPVMSFAVGRHGSLTTYILRPGDTLLVRVGPHMSAQSVNEFSEHVRAKFKDQVPDVAVYVVGGAIEQMLVYRPGEVPA